MQQPRRNTGLDDVDAGIHHAVEIPVLGITTRFVTNSEHVLAAVEDAFGEWRALERSAIDRRCAQTVRVNVRAGERDEEAEDDIAHVLPGDGRLLIRARGVTGMSDPTRGEAVAWVTEARLHQRERFRCDVLEALTWALLTRCDRQPLHAAALARGRVGLLLCGRSGSGKSTLAYAASRTGGMHALSDDTVFVQTRPDISVWGMCAPFRLMPSAAAHFSELDGVAPVRLHNGKQKVLAGARAIAGSGGAFRLALCGICVLGERRATPHVRQLSTAEAVALTDPAGDSGFDAFAATIAPAVARIATHGAWLLHPSGEPDASVPLLAGMLDSVASASATSVESFSQPGGPR